MEKKKHEEVAKHKKEKPNQNREHSFKHFAKEWLFRRLCNNWEFHEITYKRWKKKIIITTTNTMKIHTTINTHTHT